MSDYSRLILRVVNVLLSDAALKIDFVANGMHVTGAGYRIVWYALTQGWIKLTLSSGAKGAEATSMPPGVAAHYDSASHSFRFSLLEDPHWGETDPGEKAAILHESTHALRDVMASSKFAPDGLYGSNFSQQKLWDNEACAYIAESLFYFYDNPTAKDWYGGSLAKLKEAGVPRDSGPSETTVEGNIISIANRIAKSIKDKPGAVVDPKDFLSLRATVLLSPLYQEIARRQGDADPARGGAI